MGKYERSIDFAAASNLTIYLDNEDVTDNIEFAFELKLDIIEASCASLVTAAPVNATYDGKEHNVEIVIAPEFIGSYNITYYDAVEDKYTTQVPRYVDAGQYIISYKVESSNYAVYTSSTTLTIAKKATIIPEVASMNKMYDKKPIEDPAVAIETDGEITLKYYAKTGATYTLMTTKPINAGEYKLAIEVAAGANYSAATTKEVVFTITQHEIILVWSELRQNHTGDELLPKAESKNVLPDEVVITLTIAGSHSAVGEYDVVASVNDSNYTIKNPTPGEKFVIAKAEVAISDTYTRTYTGTAYSVPTNSLYNITSDNSFTNVGNYEVTLTLKDASDYVWNVDGTIVNTATITVHMVISPVSVASQVVEKASIPNMYYSGSQIKPSMTMTYSNTALVEGTDYTLTYGENVAVGKGVVHVTGINNFTGTLDVEFNIVEQKLDIDGCYAQFNPTYYKLSSATGATTVTPIARPTYDGGIYVVKFELTQKMYISEFVAMLSETQQQAIKIFNKNGYLMQVDQYSTTLLTTGIRIMLTDNDKITDNFYVSIKGDINGDGVVNTVDSNTLKKYLKGMAGIVGVYTTAADINNDGSINVADANQIRPW